MGVQIRKGGPTKNPKIISTIEATITYIVKVFHNLKFIDIW